MMSPFAIDTKNFFQPRPDLYLREETCMQRLERSTWQQNIEYIKVIDQGISEYNRSERPVIKRLKVILKIIFVASAVLMFLFPLQSYLPVWVPWGVGLPTFLILGILSVKIKQKIETKQRCYKSFLLMREMLKNHSFQALHPLGEWDLLAVDSRLKSDLVMQKELQKQHPESAGHVERLVATLDLEVTPVVKLHAARKLAQLTDNTDDWRRIKEKVIKAKQHLYEGDLEAYKQKIAEARESAFCVGGASPHLLSLPALPGKNYVRAVIGKYQYFNQVYQELARLHKEGQVLFGDSFCEKWERYLTFAESVQTEIEILNSLFEESSMSARDWLLATRAINKNDLVITVDALIEYTQRLKREIQIQIAKHPAIRIESYRKELKRFDQRILSVQIIHNLGKWIADNPEAAKRPIGEVMQDGLHDREILEWIEARGELIVDPVIEIYERNCLMNEALVRAQQIAQELFPDQFHLDLTTMIQRMQSHPEDTEYLINVIKKAPDEERVTAYNKEVMLPLRKLVGHSGESSFWKRIWKALIRKLPAHPFEPVSIPKEGCPERSRKVEELVVNDLLKKIDRKMVFANRVRRYGLEWVAIVVLLIVDVIFWSTTLWATWGIAASILLIQGVSFYVDYRLRKIDKEKQALKLQMLLRDHPKISRIPGLNPALQDLRDVQEKYHLSGTTRTWARMLAEGDEAVLSDHWRTIARKGSEEARPVIERRLLHLYSRQQEGENHQEEIQVLHDLLSPSLSHRGEAMSWHINMLAQDEKRAIEDRQHIQKRLDLIDQEIKGINGEINGYNKALEQKQNARQEALVAYMKQLVEEACRGEHTRDAGGDLDRVLQEVRQVVQRIQEQGQSGELLNQLAQIFGVLRCFPVDQLNLVIEDFKRFQHRQEILKKRIASFNRAEAVQRLERYRRLQRSAMSELARAQAEERKKGVRLDLERKLTRLDPKIEEKRKALIDDIEAQEDQKIREDLQGQLDSLNRNLERWKWELSADSSQSLTAFHGWLRRLDGVVEELTKFIKTLPEEGAKCRAFKNHLQLVKKLLCSERGIAKVFFPSEFREELV